MEEGIEKSFPFDSNIVNGECDRGYLAEDFARYFREFISSGTFMRQSDNLQVMVNGDMSVTVKKGALIIDGYRYDAEDDIIIGIEPTDGVLNRIDRISATWDREARDIHCTLQKGTASYEPIPPACRRTSDYRDYVLADIYVRAGAISIKQSDITDQRLNSEVCGLAMPFMSIDTTLIFDQLQAFYREVVNNAAEWEDEKKAGFDEWFDMIKNQLSEDAAGNLLKMINDLWKMMGSNDIPAIGDGTVTGAISSLNAGLGGLKLVALTQAEYDALENYDANTLYITT